MKIAVMAGLATKGDMDINACQRFNDLMNIFISGQGRGWNEN
jgi:hypothetical protein